MHNTTMWYFNFLSVFGGKFVVPYSIFVGNTGKCNKALEEVKISRSCAPQF